MNAIRENHIFWNSETPHLALARPNGWVVMLFGCDIRVGKYMIYEIWRPPAWLLPGPRQIGIVGFLLLQVSPGRVVHARAHGAELCSTSNSNSSNSNSNSDSDSNSNSNSNSNSRLLWMASFLGSPSGQFPCY